MKHFSEDAVCKQHIALAAIDDRTEFSEQQSVFDPDICLNTKEKQRNRDTRRRKSHVCTVIDIQTSGQSYFE